MRSSLFPTTQNRLIVAYKWLRDNVEALATAAAPGFVVDDVADAIIAQI
jgi:hypothetical protein